MAQAQTRSGSRAGHKRGPGRPARNSERVQKKVRLSSPQQQVADAPVSTPPPAKVPTPPPPPPPPPPNVKLPVKIADSRPLPSLSQPQLPSQADPEYQNIAASAVLSTSLERSRVRWVAEGVFKRYWVKPETGKHARPPPADNPDVKLQKTQGPCRIRVEPHILEADMYVEQKPRPIHQVKQYVPPGTAYRPNYGQQQTQTPFIQQRPPHPAQQTHQQAHTQLATLSPFKSVNQPVAPVQTSPLAAQQPAQPQQQDKKPSPDPVISMLATRASSDLQLKALMKEVATGNATQEQLKVFQGHIDELTKLINEKKKREEEAAAKSAVQASPQPNDAIKFDSPRPNTAAQQPRPFQPAAQSLPPIQHPMVPQYQKPSPPAPPEPQPVIFAFTSPGATEDRFLFPQHSILESLSPQHLLASFIVTRKGREAADPLGMDPDMEYWQPVTLMVEVAYKREHFLDFIKRWVKPADEVRQHMTETIERCKRAPISFLALRLPLKGSTMAETEDPYVDLLPPAQNADDKQFKPRSHVKYTKKHKQPEAVAASDPALKKAEPPDDSLRAGGDDPPPAQVAPNATAVTETKPEDIGTISTPVVPSHVEGSNPVNSPPSATTTTTTDLTTAKGESEAGRPKRATRKSVRISEA